MSSDTDRLVQFLRGAKTPLAAIFDVGTRATRLLLAPVSVPTGQWSADLFFNSRDISRLGGDVSQFDGNLEVQRSQGLERAVRFIRSNMAILRANRVQADQIHAVGTAVFRWLQHQPDILARVRSETGLDIRILSDQEEAQISLAGIAFTHDKRPGGPTIDRKSTRL